MIDSILALRTKGRGMTNAHREPRVCSECGLTTRDFYMTHPDITCRECHEAKIRRARDPQKATEPIRRKWKPL